MITSNSPIIETKEIFKLEKEIIFRHCFACRMIHLRKRVKFLWGLLVFFIPSISFILYSELFNTYLERRNADDENFSKINDITRTHTEVKMKDTENLTCLAKIVFAQSGGRLGNKLMEYANVWSLAKLNDFTPVVADDIYNDISPLFSKLSVTPLSRFLSELFEKDPKCSQVAERVFRREESRLTLPSMKQLNEMKSKGPIIIKSHSVLAETIYRMRNSLKKEFKYTHELKSYAWQTLWKAASSLNNTLLSKVTYVGVHVRRTDYPKYLLKKLGSTNVVTNDYYVRAMKYILRRINKNGNSKVVFAVTSDDMEWTTKSLIPVLNKNLQLMGLFRCNATVSWCGSEDYRKDLALLSACNHSIISYGTYGSWSALMAGGNTVVFKLDPSGKNASSAQRFGKIFTNWKIMN